MHGSLSPSLIRTLVPFVVGPLGAFLAVDSGDPGTAIIATSVIGYLFYVVVRLLETFSGPKWGYILGVAKTPGYAPGPPPQDEPAGSDRGAGELRLIALVAVGVLLALVVWALLGQVR